MKTQIIFKIDKKLKDSAMKKARAEGMTLSSFFNFAASAFVENKIDISLRMKEEKEVDESINVYKKEKANGKLQTINSLTDLDQCMKISTSSYFKRKYKKLSASLKEKAKRREMIFRKNPFDPRLETHKLHGKYKKYWAFSVTQTHRIMFDFLGNNEVHFIDVDDHSLYK